MNTSRKPTNRHVDAAAYNPEFDPKAIRKEWSKVPSDLAGWAMRANAMLILAERFHAVLTEVEGAMRNGKP